MAQVKAVPDGYATVTVHLSVNGASDALAWYAKAFGAEERGGRAMDPSGKVMHAEMKIGNSVVMIADAMMGPPATAMCHLYVEDADKWFKRATDAGAQVVMPMADMFWGDRYGVIADKWGNRWSIATHKEDLSQEEMQRRMEEQMKQRKGQH